MRPTTLFTSLCATSCAVASPLVEQRTGCPKLHNANFDNLKPGEVPLLNTVPTPYQGLAFNSFKSASGGLVSLIEAHTPPNSIEFSLTTGVTAGIPTITKNYPGSTVNDFNLHSLYIGCVTLNPTGVFLPVGCTITATGYKADGKKVTAPITFKAPTVPDLGTVTGKKTPQQMQKLPDSFSALHKVEFSVKKSGINNALTAVSFDDVVYTTYGKC